jgi:hypothetical protein
VRALLGVAVALLATTARAEIPFGTVAAVDRVELLNNATRVRIIGAFVSRDGDHYTDGRRGFVELTCPEGQEVECRAQWNTIAHAIELGACVSFDWDVAPARVYGPGTSPTAPQLWAVLRGVRVITTDDQECSRARSAPPAYAPSPKTVVVIPPDVAEPPTQHWYGWQILALGLPSQAIFWTGYALESPVLVAVGLTSWGLTSPIVHGGHGFVGRAFGGLAIELLTPLAAGSLAAALASAAGEEGVGSAATVGVLVGGVFGTAADALIGYEDLKIVPTGKGLALIGTF